MLRLEQLLQCAILTRIAWENAILVVILIVRAILLGVVSADAFNKWSLQKKSWNQRVTAKEHLSTKLRLNMKKSPYMLMV